MKKTIAGILCLLIVFALPGCAVRINVQPNTTQAAPTAAPEPTEPVGQADMAEIQGSFTDGVYSNPCLGIQGEFDESWYIASDEERMELMGIIAEGTSDEALAEQFRNAGNLIVFYAQRMDGGSVNVTLEDLGLRGVFVTEEMYVEASLEQLPAALESMGVSNVHVWQSSYTISGVEHAAVEVYGSMDGVDFYERMVCVQSGSYMGVITAACYWEDTTAEMLELFSAI